jgi:hypothetical protein
MLTRHTSDRLAAYLDGALGPREARLAELHLASCATCREERDRIRSGMQALEHLSLVEAPEAIWARIQGGVAEKPFVPRWRIAIAAAAILLLAGAGYWRFMHAPGAQWDLVRLDGAPTIAAKRVRDVGRIGAGEWVETDSKSRARLEVGAIGSVEVEQNTRLRITAARPDEHRLALERGEIRAKISAPPRLFFVDTAAGTAVDLGCEYAMSAAEDGSGVLRVTRGWVSFQWKDLESLVPAGASCRIHSHAGPGIPYFDDAPEKLKQAIDGGPLDTVLAESRVRDTLTLWHLLSRVNAADRVRVYDRMAALVPVPAGVSREQALRLDAATLKLWREELAWKW